MLAIVMILSLIQASLGRGIPILSDIPGMMLYLSILVTTTLFGMILL